MGVSFQSWLADERTVAASKQKQAHFVIPIKKPACVSRGRFLHQRTIAEGGGGAEPGGGGAP
jgi:hypothetical protein